MTVISSETYWDEDGHEHCKVTLDFDRDAKGLGPEVEQAEIYNAQAELANQLRAFQQRMLGPANEYTLFKLPGP